MAKKEKKETEKEPITDILETDTLKILDNSVKKLEEELYEKDQEELIEKAETQKFDSKEDHDIFVDTKFYFDFFMNIFVSLINPALKKFGIEELTTEETEELTKAIFSIASEKMLSTSGKIGKVVAKITSLPKLIKLFTIAWKIIFPRLTKYLETKKNKTPENIPI